MSLFALGISSRRNWLLSCRKRISNLPAHCVGFGDVFGAEAVRGDIGNVEMIFLGLLVAHGGETEFGVHATAAIVLVVDAHDGIEGWTAQPRKDVLQGQALQGRIRRISVENADDSRIRIGLEAGDEEAALARDAMKEAVAIIAQVEEQTADPLPRGRHAQACCHCAVPRKVVWSARLLPVTLITTVNFAAALV